ncbi:peroxisomal biogenesis factor 13 isoform X2 [Oratosquilla oratoria]|uniref:peroxisomal biogenesis factor 13 isoform X2 n=1 Tax=Oratosquilla oratoria TaxID=337810 RepID=UPI003F76A5B8
MSAPPKPWEQRPVNQRQCTFTPDNTNSFSQVPHHFGAGGGGGGGGNGVHTTRPPIPPRPQYNVTPYPRMNYGGYGNYNSYAGGYSSYGAANYGGYGRVNGGVYEDADGFVQMAEESSRQAFQSIESIVHAFGSVSMMLESTYHAVYSSFRAVLGVAEHFSRMKSHFGQIFSALAVVRTLRWLYRKLLYLIGLCSQDPSVEAMWRKAADSGVLGSAAQITEADLKASRSSWPIIMFMGVVFGGPYLIWRLLTSISPLAAKKSKDWISGKGDHFEAVGLFDFQARAKSELSFRCGQKLAVAPRDQQPQVRGWLLASNGRVVGLIPASYVKVLGFVKRQDDKNTPAMKSRIPTVAGPTGSGIECRDVPPHPSKVTSVPSATASASSAPLAAVTPLPSTSDSSFTSSRQVEKAGETCASVREDIPVGVNAGQHSIDVENPNNDASDSENEVV